MRLFLCVCLLQALTSEQDMQAEARAHNQKVLTIIPPASGMVWPDARSLPAMAPVDMSMLENDMEDARDDQHRWQKEISFQISPAYTKAECDRIYNGLQIVAAVFSDCLTFRLWGQSVSPTGDYVYIEKGSGCSSKVGRRGGRQVLTLGEGCVVNSVIVHEVIHALGFDHEQNRPDRDQYVNILWSNIEYGKEHNFRRTSMDTYSVSYDYHSIMHYGEKLFSKNGGKTIEAKKRDVVVGSRGVITCYDRRKLRAMYNCPESNPRKSIFGGRNSIQALFRNSNKKN